MEVHREVFACRRPSPWLVVALVALFVGPIGTAAASHLITGKDIKNGTIELSDLSRHARLELQGGRGPQGSQGQRGQPGVPGTPGAPGTPGVLAFAHVNSDGSLDAAHARNIAPSDLVEVGTSSYCFSGLNPAPGNVVATPDAFDPESLSKQTQSGLGTGEAYVGCPAGTQAFVITTVGGSFARSAFFVMFN